MNLTQISPHDTLVEVRSFLNETTELYLHSNYFFISEKDRLNEFVEFGTLNAGSSLDIKIGNFIKIRHI